MTTPEPDQVAEVLARVAEDHHLHPSMNLCLGDTCGWRPTADRGSLHRQHGAHVATEQAAALRAAGLVVEGTEVERIAEWRVESETLEDEFGEDEQAAREWLGYTKAIAHWEPATLMARTVTTRVTEWVAVDEGGE